MRPRCTSADCVGTARTRHATRVRVAVSTPSSAGSSRSRVLGGLHLLHSGIEVDEHRAVAGERVDLLLIRVGRGIRIHGVQPADRHLPAPICNVPSAAKVISNPVLPSSTPVADRGDGEALPLALVGVDVEVPVPVEEHPALLHPGPDPRRPVGTQWH